MSQTTYQFFPKAILSVSRQELTSLKLTTYKGLTSEETTLPADLQGHFFLVSPVGTFDSYQPDSSSPVVLPSADGSTPLFNGDGMVYRIDFSTDAVTLTTRIAKPPCYYADRISYEKSEFSDLRFINGGFGRFSFVKGTLAILGVRNQPNTAFVPFQFATDPQERLLLTSDTGRPFEIDPDTLEVIAPLGSNDEWSAMLPLVEGAPFTQFLTTAHPCFDPRGNQQNGEFFTVNVSKSVSTMMSLARSLRPHLEEALKLLKPSPFKRRFRVFKAFIDAFLAIDGFSDDVIYLMRWLGKAPNCQSDLAIASSRWKVLNKWGFPIKLHQTLHQMGITKDYIVLADTAFKIDFGEVLPFIQEVATGHIETLSTDLFNYPQLPYTDIYVIRRADLKPYKKSVKARHFRIDAPMAHYLVDYDSPDGKLVLHAAHNCATDPAETLHKNDQSIYTDLELTLNLQGLAGSVVGPTDVSRLGCHIIDVEKNKITSYFAHDIDYTWATAFYAYRNEQQNSHFDDIYWNSWGCWADILSKHIFDLYKDYEQRIVPLGDLNTFAENKSSDCSTLLGLTAKGVPSSICRVHLNRGDDGLPVSLELKDFYQFPEGCLGTSIQFVPKANTTGNRAGYLVCIVLKSHEFASNNSEIWIFDAEKDNLGGEPICRLTHPELSLGFTLHTTWMASKSSHKMNGFVPSQHTLPISNSYNIRQDYRERVKTWLTKELENGAISLDIAKTIEKMFEEMYERWEDAHRSKLD
ncbi:MAG: carotenoid oxygenase family protein [Oculatellaceae cyanobacterium bins.114]|nr:carotenoid oxygenase family protein [Oculatellaceae cyanobacterium bins.114]